MSERALAYGPARGWTDWGDGGLRNCRWADGGRVEIVRQPNEVTAAFPGPASAYVTSPVAADLQGDGTTEVLVRDVAGRIRVLAGASSGIARVLPFPELKCDGDSLTRGGGITVADLDGDGKRELVFRQGGRVVVADSAGKVLFTSAQRGVRLLAVGEFDGEAPKDIACYADGRWAAIDWKHGRTLWQAEELGSEEVAAADVDGDGRDELAGKLGPVFLLNGTDGRTRWQASRREMCALGLGSFADLDGDGQAEVLITGEYTNTAWRLTGQNHWWIGWSSGGNKEHYGAVADVNGDGALDLGLASNHGAFYCVDGRDARELWKYRIPQQVTLTHPAAADVDGDGRAEFVFGTMAGELLVLNGEDGSVARRLCFGSPVGAPIVADTDGDGDAEVLVVADGTLYCVDSDQGPLLALAEPDIKLDVGALKADAPAAVSATVRNVGGRDATDVSFELHCDAAPAAHARVRRVAAGAPATAEMSWRPPAGRHKLTLRVRAAGQTVETERQVTVRPAQARP
jgi:outer membrane protein assembly factor BamB